MTDTIKEKLLKEIEETNKTISCTCAGCNPGYWNKTGIIWFCWRHRIEKKESNQKV